MYIQLPREFNAASIDVARSYFTKLLSVGGGLSLATRRKTLHERLANHPLFGLMVELGLQKSSAKVHKSF
jgi:hypothetical protein